MTTDDTDSTNLHHGVYQEYGKANLETKVLSTIHFYLKKKFN